MSNTQGLLDLLEYTISELFTLGLRFKGFFFLPESLGRKTN